MKFNLTYILIFGLLLTALSACRPAHAAIEVTDPWARPGFSGGTSAVYFTIDNSRGDRDVLLSASTGVAEMAELHVTHMDEAGAMQMQELELVEITNNTILLFAPGGLHVMLVNLQQDLNPGDVFELTLFFQERGQVTLLVEVREP